MDFWRFSQTDLDPSSLVMGSYDPRLVFLSFVVASMAAYSAMEIVERVGATTDRKRKTFWLCAGSLSMGCGVWAMHFIGMLSFSLPVPVNYALQMTFLSVIPAIIASAITIRILSVPRLNHWRVNIGGLLMAGGIGTMHYTGMEAMRMPADLRYSPSLFAVSVAVAYVLATGAFYVEFRLRQRSGGDRWSAQLFGGLTLGAAVCGMHYTAMSASMFYAHPSPGGASGAVFSPFALSVAIMAVTSFIAIVAIGGTWVDRRLERAFADVQRLEGLLPICAHCKRIRDEAGIWQHVEVYVRDRSEAEFSHGICPICMKKHHPEA